MITIKQTKRYTGLIAFLFTCILTVRVQAQAGDTLTMRLKYLAAGSLNKTNDGKTWLVNNAVNFNMKKRRDVFNVNAAWVYANTNRQLTNNDFSSSMDFDIYSKDPRFYYWGLGAFDNSYSLKIVSRYQAGLGAAYTILNTPRFRFNVSDGILFEYSDLYLTDTVREKYNTFRNSLRISYHLRLKEIVSLDGQHFYQPSLTHQHDYILKSSSSLSVKLWRWVNFSVTLLYNKVSRSQRENLLFTYGLTVERQF
jgi:hypothetical protein